MKYNESEYIRNYGSNELEDLLKKHREFIINTKRNKDNNFNYLAEFEFSTLRFKSVVKDLEKEISECIDELLFSNKNHKEINHKLRLYLYKYYAFNSLLIYSENIAKNIVETHDKILEGKKRFNNDFNNMVLIPNNRLKALQKRIKGGY